MNQIDRVLLLICDTAWMRQQIAAGWGMTGADVTVEYFGTTMGRGWDSAGLQAYRERNRKWRRIATEIANRGSLDLVFMVAFDDVLEDETLLHFRVLGAKIVIYHVDMLTQWYKISRSVRYVDLLCHSSNDHLEYFRKRNIPLLDFGIAAVPPTAEEWYAPPIRYDGVLFTGSPWPYRQMVLHKIATAGLPLRIYGHNWDRKGAWPKTPGQWRKSMHDVRWYLIPRLRVEGWELAERVARRLMLTTTTAVALDKFPPGVVSGNFPSANFLPMTRGAAINLGFTQMPLNPKQEYPRMIRIRDFEVPIAGGFYLAQNCPELSKYYEINREVAVWETAADVVDRCRYYLGRPEERASIAEAGRQRALRNHTWTHRLAAMAERLGMRLRIRPRRIADAS